MGMYKTLRELMFNVNVYKPAYEDMKNLNNTMFDDMNMIDLERKYHHEILPETVPSFATHTTLPPTSPTSVNFSNTHSSRKQDPASTIFPSSTNPTQLSLPLHMNLQLLTPSPPPARHMDSNKPFHLLSIRHTISHTMTTYTLLQPLPPTHLNKVPTHHTMQFMKESTRIYPTATPTTLTMN